MGKTTHKKTERVLSRFVPQNTYKPDFVEDDHLSRMFVAKHLKRATKFALAPERVYHVTTSPWDERCS